MRIANQAKTIRQLSEVYSSANAEIEALKTKVCSYMESVTLYKGENEDLRVRCEELEEMLRQEESKLEIANKEKLEVLELNEQILKEKQKVEYQLVTQHKDITKYQETIENLQKAKQEAEENAHAWYLGMVKGKERIDYWKEAYTKISFEMEEAKKPWYKKLFRGAK